MGRPASAQPRPTSLCVHLTVHEPRRPMTRAVTRRRAIPFDLATGAQNVFNTLCSNQTVHFLQRERHLRPHAGRRREREPVAREPLAEHGQRLLPARRQRRPLLRLERHAARPRPDHRRPAVRRHHRLAPLAEPGGRQRGRLHRGPELAPHHLQPPRRALAGLLALREPFHGRRRPGRQRHLDHHRRRHQRLHRLRPSTVALAAAPGGPPRWRSRGPAASPAASG